MGLGKESLTICVPKIILWSDSSDRNNIACRCCEARPLWSWFLSIIKSGTFGLDYYYCYTVNIALGVPPLCTILSVARKKASLFSITWFRSLSNRNTWHSRTCIDDAVFVFWVGRASLKRVCCLGVNARQAHILWILVRRYRVIKAKSRDRRYATVWTMTTETAQKKLATKERHETWPTRWKSTMKTKAIVAGLWYFSYSRFFYNLELSTLQVWWSSLVV